MIASRSLASSLACFTSTLAAALASAPALADTCARPDAPAGYLGYAYGDAAPQAFDGARVRVHYVTTGAHAVLPAADATGVPLVVRRVAEVGDDALVRFAEQGFRAPVSDGKAACGDGPLLDVYLVQFGKSDGLTATEGCVQKGDAAVCASFVLVDSRLDKRYPTEDEGIRTVVPHELFHVVQNAYDANLSRFWAEGTAQWAAAKLDPSLPDLASYVSAFLKEPDRALDGPVNGVTGAYLYGSALWPLFLAQTHGDAVIEEILTEEASGTTSLKAADAVLQTHGSDLATAYATFAQWNLSTGKRAAPGGYPEASTYGLVPLRAFALGPDGGGSVADVMAGLSNIPFSLEASAEADLSLDADAARTRAFFVPLVDGRAVFADSKPLPTVVPANAAGIAVVVNGTTSKVDSPFTLVRKPRTGAGASGAGGQDAGSAGSAGSGGSVDQSPPPPPASTDDGGCAFVTRPASTGPLGALGTLFAVSFLTASRSRNRPR